MFTSKCVDHKGSRAVRPSGVGTLVVSCLWTEESSSVVGGRGMHYLGDKTRFRTNELFWDVCLGLWASRPSPCLSQGGPRRPAVLTAPLCRWGNRGPERGVTCP